MLEQHVHIKRITIVVGVPELMQKCGSCITSALQSEGDVIGGLHP
jgi:hypothetical protein